MGRNEIPRYLDLSILKKFDEIRFIKLSCEPIVIELNRLFTNFFEYYANINNIQLLFQLFLLGYHLR